MLELLLHLRRSGADADLVAEDGPVGRVLEQVRDAFEVAGVHARGVGEQQTRDRITSVGLGHGAGR